MSLRKPLQLNESVRKLCKLTECDFLFLKITLEVFYLRFNFCIFSLYYSFNQLQYFGTFGTFTTPIYKSRIIEKEFWNYNFVSDKYKKNITE